MSDPRKQIFDAVRAARSSKAFDQMEVGALDNLLDAFGVPRAGQAPKTDNSPKAVDPPWIREARKLMGTAEIPGPKHNPFIVAAWKRLGAGWFTDDETPWCGLFVAHCMEAVGLPFPKLFPRAMSWAEWGKPCPQPTYGAVVVFKRSGGGHVGFLVGEDIRHYHVLGGNQSNAVNVMRLEKDRAVAIRWPSSLGLPTPGLPKLVGGHLSKNEA